MPGSLTVGMALGAVVTAGLTAAVAPLLGQADEVDAPSCAAFQIGSESAAETRLHLENVSSASQLGLLELTDEHGIKLWAASSSVSLDPRASQDIVFKTPPPGTIAKLNFLSSQVRSSVMIVPNDDRPSELRRAILCAVDPVDFDPYGS